MRSSSSRSARSSSSGKTRPDAIFDSSDAVRDAAARLRSLNSSALASSAGEAASPRRSIAPRASSSPSSTATSSSWSRSSDAATRSLRSSNASRSLIAASRSAATATRFASARFNSSSPSRCFSARALLHVDRDRRGGRAIAKAADARPADADAARLDVLAVRVRALARAELPPARGARARRRIVSVVVRVVAAAEQLQLSLRGGEFVGFFPQRHSVPLLVSLEFFDALHLRLRVPLQRANLARLLLLRRVVRRLALSELTLQRLLHRSHASHLGLELSHLGDRFRLLLFRPQRVRLGLLHLKLPQLALHPANFLFVLLAHAALLFRALRDVAVDLLELDPEAFDLGFFASLFLLERPHALLVPVRQALRLLLVLLQVFDELLFVLDVHVQLAKLSL
eukprot:31115-Pelagococcus_subviridis.AAC.12